MKNIPKLDQSTLRILYTKYKAYLLPVGIIVMCLLIFIQFTLQQVQGFFTTQDEERLLRIRIAMLKQNKDLLTTLPDETLDQQVQTVSTALPSQKDFSGIITALSEAASEAGVGLGDYSFQVGDLSDRPDVTLVGQPFIEVNLLINGGIEGVKNFTQVLAEKLPLSEIISTQLTNTDATVKVFFYYKPFTVSQVSTDRPLQGFSQKEVELINTLASWETR